MLKEGSRKRDKEFSQKNGAEVILMILLEGENEGGRVGNFAAEVHHSVAQCQT